MLQEIKSALNLTQIKLAEAMGVKVDRVKSLTSGKVAKLTQAETKSLVENLHVNPGWLATGDGDMFQSSSEQAFSNHLNSLQQATKAVMSLNLSDERKRQVRDILFAVSENKTELIERAFSIFSTQASDQSVMVPRYDAKGSSGPGSLVEADRIVEHIAFNSIFIRDVVRVPSQYLAIIEVTGQSMEPTLSSGEQVLVDMRRNRFVDDAVYVLQQDGHLRIKRVQVRMDGTVLIKSDNAFYDDEVYSREMADGLHVIGTVLPYKIGRFKL